MTIQVDTDSPSAEHQRSTPSIRQVRGNVDQEAGWDSKMRQKMSDGVDTRSLEEVIRIQIERMLVTFYSDNIVLWRTKTRLSETLHQVVRCSPFQTADASLSQGPLTSERQRRDGRNCELMEGRIFAKQWP